MSELVIVRAPSGYGKSTFVKKNFAAYQHFEADMFFIRDGEYLFDRNKLGSAHKWCQAVTKQALRDGKDVVVSNTSTTLKEVNDYIRIVDEINDDKFINAESKVCNKFPVVTFRVIRLNKQFQNIHSVPNEVVEAMKSRMQDYPGETVLTEY